MNHRVRKILVTGCPGSGKTTLARQLAEGLGVPHIELDGLHHGPGWTPADPQVFQDAVRAELDRPGWVVDGNYRLVAGLIRSRADLVVALDLPRPVVFVRLLRRTLRRMITRQELWNGNREKWRDLFSLDPDRNILLWAHHKFPDYRARAAADELDFRAGGPAAVRLRSTAAVRRFVRRVTAPGGRTA